MQAFMFKTVSYECFVVCPLHLAPHDGASMDPKRLVRMIKLAAAESQ